MTVETSQIKAQGRATLSEIAKSAGVSVSTASLVLADKAKERRISDAVITRVQTAAKTMDYAPNLLVQSMQRGQTHVLSFFNGFRNRNQDDLYMDRLSTAIEQAAGRRGYDILIYCDFRRSDQETYRNLNGGRCDGLLFFAPQATDQLLPYLRKSRLPVVLVNRFDPEHVLSSIHPHPVGGIDQIAGHLVGLGHRRFAAITNIPGGNPAAAERIAQLEAFLATHQITVPERWIVPANDHRPSDAEDALRFLMAEPEPPTALFCWHDRVGYQILEQCDVQGVAVPEQLSLFGYDGLHWPAATRHTLASVSMDLERLAEAAVDLLDGLIRRQVAAPVEQVLPVSPKWGTTLGPPLGSHNRKETTL